MTETTVPADASAVPQATAAAAAAAPQWAATPGARRAATLRRIAAALDESTGELVKAADSDTALGADRLTGEVARTTGQLRMFADLIEDGSELDAIISEADPGAGRADIRRMQRPLGPVAVFSASNFPFAFSVAGGDTASALAAGCPVVVKAHEGHPETSRRTVAVIAQALADSAAPEGLLQTVYGVQQGRALVLDPVIQAVGFTGSLAGGTALMKLAQSRPDPIPFFGELGSINPIVVLKGAAADRPEQIAAGYVGSLTLGVGQFCTNPGLVFMPAHDELLEAVCAEVSKSTGSTMLTERIYDQYERLVRAEQWTTLDLIGRGTTADKPWAATPQVRTVPLARFADSIDELTSERFGPAGLVVTYTDLDEVLKLLPSLPGSLVGGVHATDAELADARRVADALAVIAGRLVFNGWPTGVAVCWGMHHGGPWPASTAPSTTSVGATAIRRWLAPIAYQDFPDELLPDALKRANPLGIERLQQPS